MDGFLLEIASGIVAACVLAGLGDRIVRVVPARYRLFHATIPVHPILTGAALGLLPSLPAPTWMGGGMAGRVLWYAAAGVLAVPVYRVIRRLIDARGRAA